MSPIFENTHLNVGTMGLQDNELSFRSGGSPTNIQIHNQLIKKIRKNSDVEEIFSIETELKAHKSEKENFEGSEILPLESSSVD